MGLKENVEDNIIWLQDIRQLHDFPRADAIIDLLFENQQERVQVLEQYLPALVIINSVAHTLSETHINFVRINGWNSFLKAQKIEASAPDHLKERTEIIFRSLDRELEWVPDEPGFISPRVISMIINEAFLALQEGVSTRNEIDTAMKLGTNYPYGPFEWAEKIGISSVSSLLSSLAKKNNRYQPAPGLSGQ